MLTKEQAKRVKADIKQYEADTGKKFRTAHVTHDGFYSKCISIADIENGHGNRCLTGDVSVI